MVDMYYRLEQYGKSDDVSNTPIAKNNRTNILWLRLAIKLIELYCMMKPEFLFSTIRLRNILNLVPLESTLGGRLCVCFFSKKIVLKKLPDMHTTGHVWHIRAYINIVVCGGGG
jgi:hypothetical protein